MFLSRRGLLRAVAPLVALAPFARLGVPLAMAQTTTTIATVPVGNQHQGTVTVPAQPMPAGLDSFTVQINCTTGNPANPFQGFSHPFSSASQSISFGINWSWDGGVTFPGATSGTQQGSPTGTWGTNKAGVPNMTPTVDLGVPFDSNLGGAPNAFQAFMTVLGTSQITFGLTVLQTVG